MGKLGSIPSIDTGCSFWIWHYKTNKQPKDDKNEFDARQCSMKQLNRLKTCDTYSLSSWSWHEKQNSKVLD
jgi:hypothetical protein